MYCLRGWLLHRGRRQRRRSLLKPPTSPSTSSVTAFEHLVATLDIGLNIHPAFQAGRLGVLVPFSPLDRVEKDQGLVTHLRPHHGELRARVPGFATLRHHGGDRHSARRDARRLTAGGAVPGSPSSRRTPASYEAVDAHSTRRLRQWLRRKRKVKKRNYVPFFNTRLYHSLRRLSSMPRYLPCAKA